MTKKQLVIQHDLSKLSVEQTAQYLRDVSEFIGLDPDLNGLDTIWMDNETGPGKSLVVYARRGTAEILRNNRGIEVSSLTDKEIKGSLVFTATGKDKSGRQEIATGSKNISNVSGKQLDDAIMTASTRALRRLTMQFTSLGILDESEVKATVGDLSNPAAGATLSGSPLVLVPMPSSVNNTPGRDITPTDAEFAAAGIPKHGPIPAVTMFAPQDAGTQAQIATVLLINQAENLAKVYADGAAALAAMPTPGEHSVTQNPPNQGVTLQEIPAVEAAKPKRARKPRNTVSMEGVEPEVVNSAKPAPAAPKPQERLSGVTVSGAVQDRLEQTGAVPVQVNPAAPIQAFAAVPALAYSAPIVQGVVNPMPPVPAPPSTQAPTSFPGQPTEAQMGDYRKRVGVYTSELPSSENMGSVQKMRAFITRQTGSAPQYMSTFEWEEMLAWFEQFVNKNSVKGLVKYINDSLGVS